MEQGKYKDMTGSLLCAMESGNTFNCGSGLTDEERTNPPIVRGISPLSMYWIR